MRYIKLNENKKIYSIRYANEIVDSEIESELGELGQIMLEDGTFIDDPQDIINKQNAEKEVQKNYLIQQMLVANALRDDALWQSLKGQYDAIK
jgi:hypothetical protein